MLRQKPSFTLFPYTTLFRSVRRETMTAASKIARDRGIHEDARTGTTNNISTAMPMCSHQSTVRIPPIKAAHGHCCADVVRGDRKSTRLNSSHGYISYAVFCL